MQVFQQVVSHAKAGHAITGSCFWMTASSAYPDYDGMTVYFQAPTAEVEAKNAELRAERAQPEQQQCSADSLGASSNKLDSKLHSTVRRLHELSGHSNQNVVEVIRHNAKTMHELNRHGQDCKVM